MTDNAFEIEIPSYYADGTRMTLDVSTGSAEFAPEEDFDPSYREFDLSDLAAGESKTITFDLMIDGMTETFTVTVSATGEADFDMSAITLYDVSISSYVMGGSSVDLDALNNNGSASIEIPSNYTKAPLYLSVETEEPGTRIVCEGEESKRSGLFVIENLSAGESRKVDFTVTSFDGTTTEKYSVTVSATGEESQEFEEELEIYLTEYTFTLNANGGEFADGSDEKDFTAKVFGDLDLSDYEAPTRDGYVFIGWMDSDECWIDELYYTDPTTLYAQWQSADVAELRDANVVYTLGADEEGSNSRGIWSDDDKNAEVKLPFNVNKESVYIEVVKADRTREKLPVTFAADGTAYVEYTAKSYDKTNEINYSVAITIEPAPTEPYDMRVDFYTDEDLEWSDYEYFSFKKDGTATVELPYGTIADAPIYVCGNDLDATEINQEIKLDANGKGAATVTSKNGRTYTVNVMIAEPSTKTDCSFDIYVTNGTDDDYIYIPSSIAKKASGVTVTVPYGVITDLDPDAENYIRVRANASSGAIIEGMPYDEDECEYQMYINPGAECTKEFTVIAQDGKNTRDYKLNFVEAEGDYAGLNWLEAEFMYSGASDYEDDMYYDSVSVNLKEAVTKEGTTVEIPYYYDELYGINLAGYGPQFQTIEGLGEYTLEDGKATAVVEAVSANGKEKVTYTIHFVLGEQSKAPENLRVRCEAGAHGEYTSTEVAFDKTNTADVVVPYSYDKEYGIRLSGYDVDGKEVEESLKAGANTFKSANGVTYTINVKVAEKSSDTGCTLRLYVSKGDYYDVVHIDTEKAKTGTTVTVPYESIQAMEDEEYNGIDLYAETNSITASMDIKYDEDDGEYYEALTSKDGKTITKTVTVTAEDGSKQAYTFTIVESKGDKAALDYLEADFPYMSADGEASFYKRIDLEKAATVAGATVTVPYQFDEEVPFCLYGEAVDFGTVEGCEDKAGDRIEYYLKDGKATVVITAKSPDGKDTKKYTVHFVRDTVGNNTELEWVEVYGYDKHSYSNVFYVEGNLSQMTSGNTLTMIVPADMTTRDDIFIDFSARAEGFGLIEATWTDENGDVMSSEDNVAYAKISLKNRDYQVVQLKVHSANGKVTETYTINVLKQGCKMPSCAEHVYEGWVVKTKAAVGKAGLKEKACIACGNTVQLPIPAVVAPAVAKTYNTKNQSQVLYVKDIAGKAITSATLTGMNVGTYTKTIALSGDYTGSVKATFKINPKGVAISKLRSGKKSMTVKWKKPTGKYLKQTTGYEIRYSLKKSMAGAKIKPVKKAKTTSLTIKKLKAKKKYYVQIRTYKTVKGVKHYSSWSKKKTVKVK